MMATAMRRDAEFMKESFTDNKELFVERHKVATYGAQPGTDTAKQGSLRARLVQQL